MKVLNKVTVTGADDSVDISKLIEIQQKYPFVEWGILLSKKYSLKDGVNRFPSRAWLNSLISNVGKLNLSGHICGDWVKETLLGQFPALDEIHGNFTSSFMRFQLNTHAEPHKVDFDKLDIVLNSIRGQSIIFQLDGVNDIMCPMWKRNHRNISGLFDLSHGAGILPSKWPHPLPGAYCGYAGGLSPDNVVHQMGKIIEACKDRKDDVIWIDAETHLRNDGDRVFDLELVTKFLENSKQFVI